MIDNVVVGREYEYEYEYEDEDGDEDDDDGMIENGKGERKGW